MKKLKCSCQKYVNKGTKQTFNTATIEYDNKIYAFGGRQEDGIIERNIVSFDKGQFCSLLK